MVVLSWVTMTNLPRIWCFMSVRKILLGCVLFVASTAALADPDAGAEFWSYRAIVATPHWQGFVEKMHADYLLPVSDDALKQSCEVRLARQPVSLSDDGPGACISAVLGGLDDQSEYIDPKEYAEKQRASKPSVGLGLEIGAKTIGQGLRIVSPLSGSPGERAGIQSGDVLLSVDGKDLLPLTMEQSVLALRGEDGSEAKIRLIRRNVAEQISITVVRARIRISVVRARMLTSVVAYARIVRLNTSAHDDLVRALFPLRTVDGSTPMGIVLDLRGNQGGLLDQLPEVAAKLAPSGVPVVRSQGRSKTDVLKTSDSGQRSVNHWTETVPMVVLIDERTAAGAEALAQFLREVRGARLVGMATAGSTLVRTVRKIGGDAAVELVSAELSSPLGVQWRKGLVPDLSLQREAVRYEYEDLRGSWLQAALNDLLAQLR